MWFYEGFLTTIPGQRSFHLTVFAGMRNTSEPHLSFQSRAVRHRSKRLTETTQATSKPIRRSHQSTGPIQVHMFVLFKQI